MIKQVTLILAFLITLSLPVSAQDFDKGMAAYGDGDHATAAQEWRPLAEQGDAIAQFYLGYMYSNGQGVPQDYAQAVRWYRLAAGQGDSDAQTNLGVLYRQGLGVLQYNVMAHMWFNIGATNSSEVGRIFRDQIAEKMTTADISKAQAMARECMSSDYKKCGY